MRLGNRAMLPPHSSSIGNLFGTNEEAEVNIAYLEERARAGAAWIGSVSALMRNILPPGFDPVGVGSTVNGYVRLPQFADRISALALAVHDAQSVLTVQLVNQGGMPHAPSATLSGPVLNSVPHPMCRDEIDWYVREYADSAELCAAAGADGVEIHLNHDDLHEWFLSPKTNIRDDEYGGSQEGRATFTVRVLRAIRERVGTGVAVGVRLDIFEQEPGGYSSEGGLAIAEHLCATGYLDYVHGVVGSPWGDPSYIQPNFFDPGAWADSAQQLKRSLPVPVVHSGRITSPSIAENILAHGKADVVGIARAHIADGQFLAKAARGVAHEIRPCIGSNECISRRHVEGLSFGCAVNPTVGRPVLERARSRRRLVVVGGGPAGLELAASTQELGFDVVLFEVAEQLGGQLNVFKHAPNQAEIADYLDWQVRRLHAAGVEVRLGTRATTAAIVAESADVVAVATGAVPRSPAIPGVERHLVVDCRAVLTQAVEVGDRVAVIAEDDHLAPITVTDQLASLGHRVTLVYPGPAPAPLVGRYTLGAALARLDRLGVEVVTLADVAEIGEGRLLVRHPYSQRTRPMGDFDSVVLACGSVPEASLFSQLVDEGLETHILGDAYAPRRIVMATTQANSVARLLLSGASA